LSFGGRYRYAWSPRIIAPAKKQRHDQFPCGRRKKLDAKKRLEIAESVLSGRKSGAEMARLCDVSVPTVSRLAAVHRQTRDLP
jgi:hypothetical protein